MKTALWQMRWGVVATFVFVVTILGACVTWPILWDVLGVNHENPYFLDLAAILAASDARAAGVDPYAIPSPFDVLGRPHVYGPWWLYLDHIGLGRDDLFWLGGILAITSVGAMVWALRPRGIAQVAAASLLLASPSLLLAYERGNNDLVVVLLLLLAGAFTPGHVRSLVVRSLVVFVAAALKFYPVAALPMLVTGNRPRRALLAVGAVSAAGFLTWWIWRDDFANAIAVMPKPITLYGYGWRITTTIWKAGHDLPRLLVFSFCLLLACSAFVWAASGRVRSLDAMSSPRTKEGAWFVGAGGCWAFCYFANSNFPYRAALLVLAASVWFAMWRGADEREKKCGRRLVWLLVALFGLGLIRLWIAFLVGGIRGEAFGLSLLGLEQGLVLGFSVLIVVALLRRAWRILGEWRGLPST